MLLGRRQRQRPVVRGRHLAGETEDAETVGPVRRDLEVDHGVAAAELFDRRDLESAKPYRLGDFFSRCRDVDEFAQPGDDQSHLVI